MLVLPCQSQIGKIIRFRLRFQFGTYFQHFYHHLNRSCTNLSKNSMGKRYRRLLCDAYPTLPQTANCLLYKQLNQKTLFLCWCECTAEVNNSFSYMVPGAGADRLETISVKWLALLVRHGMLVFCWHEWQRLATSRHEINAESWETMCIPCAYWFILFYFVFNYQIWLTADSIQAAFMSQ